MSQNPLSLILQNLVGLSVESSEALSDKVTKLCANTKKKLEEKSLIIKNNMKEMAVKIDELNKSVERLSRQRRELTKQIEEDDKLIAIEKFKIKNLREERDDTKNEELTNIIREHWIKIHEIEKHRESLQTEKNQLDTQINTIHNECEDFLKQYNAAFKEGPSFFMTALELLDERSTEQQQSE